MTLFIAILIIANTSGNGWLIFLAVAIWFVEKAIHLMIILGNESNQMKRHLQVKTLMERMLGR